MSSPVPFPENAAPPALLSPENEAAPVAAAAAAVPDLRTAEVYSQNVDLSPSAFRPQPSSATPSIRNSDSDKDPSRDNTKLRGPSQPAQRQSGPSLLSQALASARGILQNGQKNSGGSDSRSWSSATSLTHYDRSSTSGGGKSVKTQANGQTRLRDREQESSNASPHSTSRSAHVNDGDNQSTLEYQPAPTETNMSATTTIPITTASSYDRDPAISSQRYDSSFPEPAKDPFMDHRGFLERAGVRAATSLDLDRAASDFIKSRALTSSASPDEPPHSSSLTAAESQAGTAVSVSDPFSVASPSTPGRTHGDNRVIVSPEKTEKIWSIGSGDAEEEDGLVEKSVTEAMAGVEHNARSRKASYSLRFFKEGLPPEDKPRRKERTSTRDKTSPTKEEGGTSDTPSIVRTPVRNSQQVTPHSTRQADAAPRAIDDATFVSASNHNDGDATIATLRAERDQDLGEARLPPPTQVGPGSASGLGVEGQGDPADGSHNSTSQAGAADPSQGRHSVRSGRNFAGRFQHKAHVDPDTDADADVEGDADADTEDAEESGEEKISSAVFLPHQEMPEVCAPLIPLASPSQSQRPRSISHSSSHPWLVKADEPHSESETHERDEVTPPTSDTSQSYFRENAVPRDVDHSRREKRDESTPIGDRNVNSHAVAKPSAVVTSYEDHAHHHQYHPRQPLEAIELIPYKHQVGGHTTLWRFSRRAVCKQLNNRENEFYETIERYHRDLLPFLPRYVLSNQENPLFLSRKGKSTRVPLRIIMGLIVLPFTLVRSNTFQQIYRCPKCDVSKAAATQECDEEGRSPSRTKKSSRWPG